MIWCLDPELSASFDTCAVDAVLGCVCSGDALELMRVRGTCPPKTSCSAAGNTRDKVRGYATNAWWGCFIVMCRTFFTCIQGRGGEGGVTIVVFECIHLQAVCSWCIYTSFMMFWISIAPNFATHSKSTYSSGHKPCTCWTVAYWPGQPCPSLCVSWFFVHQKPGCMHLIIHHHQNQL